MRTAVRWSVALLWTAALSGTPAVGDETSPRAGWQRPELAYFDAVNRAGPLEDPQLLLLLMAQYANANRHREGITVLSALVKDFEPRLSEAQQSLYLSAIGLLRAGHAERGLATLDSRSALVSSSLGASSWLWLGESRPFGNSRNIVNGDRLRAVHE